MTYLEDSTIINLTHAKSSDIKQAIYNHTDFLVYDFCLHIEQFHGEIIDNNPELTLDISLWEGIKSHRQDLDFSNILISLDLDDRFTQQSWISSITSYGRGHRLHVPIVVDILRYFQILGKLKFLL